MKRFLLHSKLLCFILLLFSLLFSAIADEKADKVDKLFAKWDTRVSPGAALAIIKDGEIIYKRGYGMANLEHNIPVTTTSVFRIGSTSKQFTAACIAILALQEKISLDDDVRKYIPEIPKYQKPIKVRNLVHHTSGLRDYTSLLPRAGYRTDADSPTIEETIEMLARQKGLDFAPGEEYPYSNSGYFLMSVIVERASGKSLNDFAQEYIFEPLGMKNTHFHDDFQMIVKNRADGYSPRGDGYRIDMTNWDHVGDGGIYTTVEDFYLWDQAFYNNTLGRLRCAEQSTASRNFQALVQFPVLQHLKVVESRKHYRFSGANNLEIIVNYPPYKISRTIGISADGDECTYMVGEFYDGI